MRKFFKNRVVQIATFLLISSLVASFLVHGIFLCLSLVFLAVMGSAWEFHSGGLEQIKKYRKAYRDLIAFKKTDEYKKKLSLTFHYQNLSGSIDYYNFKVSSHAYIVKGYCRYIYYSPMMKCEKKIEEVTKSKWLDTPQGRFPFHRLLRVTIDDYKTIELTEHMDE